MKTSLKKSLTEQQVEASAPCRIDAGGTWDIKAFALPFEALEPTTVNAALNLRTTVTLRPFDDGYIRILSDGFPEGRIQTLNEGSFDPPFGLFFAALSHFQVHGVEIYIRSSSPVKSALGGSSTALVALLKALGKALALEGRKAMGPRDILFLAYHLEDAISGGNCGLQDQAAAVYGGVHQWNWRHGHARSPFKSIRLLDRRGQKAFSERLLVAYSGEAHVSHNTNRKWIRDFLSGKTRSGWIQANHVVHGLARALQEKDWSRCALLLQEEMGLRKKITPEALIPVSEKLIGQAEGLGCGARFTGAGAGGCLWAVGRKKDVVRLSCLWEETLSGIPGGALLHCGVDPAGVK